MSEEVPTKIIVDCATGQTQVLPLTEEEISQREADAAAAAVAEAERIAAEEASTAAKASALAKLTDLGLTEEEALAIIGS
jgi:hypothetical protein